MKSMTADRRAEIRAKVAELRAFRRAHGQCVFCGADAPTWCIDCKVKRERRQALSDRKRSPRLAGMSAAAYRVRLKLLAEVAADGGPVQHERPATRAECPTTRPCPFIGCRHHLALEVSEATGEIRWNPAFESSCSLDVAERGGLTLDEVATEFGLTAEAIRQTEISGLMKLRRGPLGGST